MYRQKRHLIRRKCSADDVFDSLAAGTHEFNTGSHNTDVRQVHAQTRAESKINIEIIKCHVTPLIHPLTEKFIHACIKTYEQLHTLRFYYQ